MVIVMARLRKVMKIYLKIALYGFPPFMGMRDFIQFRRCLISPIVGEPKSRIVQTFFFLHPKGIRLKFCIVIV